MSWRWKLSIFFLQYGVYYGGVWSPQSRNGKLVRNAGQFWWLTKRLGSWIMFHMIEKWKPFTLPGRKGKNDDRLDEGRTWLHGLGWLFPSGGRVASARANKEKVVLRHQACSGFSDWHQATPDTTYCKWPDSSKEMAFYPLFTPGKRPWTADDSGKFLKPKVVLISPGERWI